MLGPEVRPPRASPPDLAPDDRLSEQAEAEEEKADTEHPMDDLGRRFHLRRPLLHFFQVGEQARDDPEVEQCADEHDEQRRLDGEVPEAVLVGVEQRDPVRLDERPDSPASAVSGPSAETAVFRQECLVLARAP